MSSSAQSTPMDRLASASSANAAYNNSNSNSNSTNNFEHAHSYHSGSHYHQYPRGGGGGGDHQRNCDENNENVTNLSSRDGTPTSENGDDHMLNHHHQQVRLFIIDHRYTDHSKHGLIPVKVCSQHKNAENCGYSHIENTDFYHV